MRYILILQGRPPGNATVENKKEEGQKKFLVLEIQLGLGNTVRLLEKLAVPYTASRTVRLRTAFLWDFGNAIETMALLHYLIHVLKSPLKKTFV